MQIKNYCSVFLCVSLLIFLPSISVAGMVLNQSIIHFESGESGRYDLVVENSEDAPLYLKITPNIILNPGSDQQKREKITNPKKAGLLVSPNRLIIPPRGKKLIRFVNLLPKRLEEGVYRVVIEPVIGDVKSEQNGVKVLIGYEVLVLVQPNELVTDLNAERSAKSITLSNNGNSNIFLLSGKQCPEGVTEVSSCNELGSKRLYPGNSWTLPLNHDTPVEYQLSVGTKNMLRTIP
jgi:P pilus assembly chaperone PapD